MEAPNAGVVCRCPKGKSAIWPGVDYQCARNAVESKDILQSETSSMQNRFPFNELVLFRQVVTSRVPTRRFRISIIRNI